MSDGDVLVYDSAGGHWPLRGEGLNGVLLVYSDSWGGWWGGVHYESNFLWAKARFPKAWLVQISVVSPAQPDVAVYDCEQGALTPGEVCAEANTLLVRKLRVPTIYGSASTRDEIVDVLATDYKRWELGRDIDFLLARPDGVATIEEGDIGKQYLWNFPPGCDTSVVRPTWVGLKPA
jgi:hypothetical protein